MPFPSGEWGFSSFAEEPGHQRLLPLVRWLAGTGAAPAGDLGQVTSWSMVALRVALSEGGVAVEWESSHRSRLAFLPGGQSSPGCHGVCSSHNSEKSLPAVH